MGSSGKIGCEQSEIGISSGNWEEAVFSEVVEVNPKRDLRKGETARSISMADLEPFQRKVANSVTRKFKGGSKFKNGDTLLARITPCLENGKTAFVDILDNEETAFGSTEFIVLSSKKNTTDAYYVYYLARSPDIRKTAIKSMTGTSGRQRVESSVFDSIIINLPSLPEQKKIGQILSDLDSRIEVNQCINETLDALGQAIFRHWFVDFEFPNEEGKPYKSSGSEMVSSELGDIPQDWKVTSILDFADILSGGTPKTEITRYWGAEIFWVSAKDVTNAQGTYIIDTERKISRLGLDNSNAKILPKNTTVVTARGTVGSYCLLSKEMSINQTNYGLKPKKGVGDFFLFFLISNLVRQMKQSSYGTIFDTITTRTFEELKTVIPPDSTVKSFDKLVKPIMDLILNNLEQSQNLSLVRDSLLPKLMSGEIRVKVTEGVSAE